MKIKFCFTFFLFCLFFLYFHLRPSAFRLLCAEEKDWGTIINADRMEYLTGARDIVAIGNVEVIDKGVKLTCDSLTVNSQTKDGLAEGNARLENEKGVIEGEKIVYNFLTRKGRIIDGEFRANPYFGRAEEVERVSDKKFTAKRGYFTTCGFDTPHYRIKSKLIDVLMEDRIRARNNVFYAGKVPLAYLPFYSHSLKEPIMHVRFMPGHSKDWGSYMLSGWRYNLTEYINGRIYLDYRDRTGMAEGFGFNFDPPEFGEGDFKYYYTQERNRRLEEGEPAEFQRYFIRWRHQWDIDEDTGLTIEYYKITDSKRQVLGTQHNVLKDYFFREYEKESQPVSYAFLHRAFDYSALDLLLEKRTNRWYTQTEKLPVATYTLPSIQLGTEGSPFYFSNTTTAGSYNSKAAAPSLSENDVSLFRVDTDNRLSLPMKMAFISLTPFASSRNTYYDKNVYGSSTELRTAVSAGTDMSTKFYRIFNVKTDAFGLDINRLRHIITPAITYNYTHEPTVPNHKLKQIDSADSLSRSHSASLEFSNKLQTKRNGQSVDLVDVTISNSYTFKPKSGSARGSSLGNYLFELETRPYSWLGLSADFTYQSSGDRNDVNYRRVSNVNYDLALNLAEERQFTFGQRYQRKGGNQFVYEWLWRLNPKWKFSIYHQYEVGHDQALKRGLREQEYFIARDLHCWTVELRYNIERGEGEGIWMIWRLKAFPEMEFGYDQTYHQRKPGSQSY